MLRVHVVNGSGLHRRMYLQNGYSMAESLYSADLVHFTGGADVSPALYGQAVHPMTSPIPDRDKADVAAYEMAIRLGLSMVGECRGAQFLNVMSGGSMYQDVDGHTTGQHMMVDVRSGAMFPVTSTHHQMMHPSRDGQVLGVASESTVYEYMSDGIQKYIPKRGEDVEVVHYRSTKCLCFQGHPEYVGKEDACQKYFFELLQEFTC